MTAGDVAIAAVLVVLLGPLVVINWRFALSDDWKDDE